MRKPPTVVEEWRPIPGFSYYKVSDQGQIYSELSDHILRPSANNYGHTKILIRDDNSQPCTRSVALLVAQAFVEPPNSYCDQVIVLDGNLRNVAAYNLAWRTSRHAWLYSNQLKARPPVWYLNLKVANINRNIEYDSIVQAGMAEGLLFEEIWKSVNTPLDTPLRPESRVPPYGHVFEVTEKV